MNRNKNICIKQNKPITFRSLFRRFFVAKTGDRATDAFMLFANISGVFGIFEFIMRYIISDLKTACKHARLWAFLFFAFYAISSLLNVLNNILKQLQDIKSDLQSQNNNVNNPTNKKHVE